MEILYGSKEMEMDFNFTLKWIHNTLEKIEGTQNLV